MSRLSRLLPGFGLLVMLKAGPAGGSSTWCSPGPGSVEGIDAGAAGGLAAMVNAGPEGGLRGEHHQ